MEKKLDMGTCTISKLHVWFMIRLLFLKGNSIIDRILKKKSTFLWFYNQNVLFKLWVNKNHISKAL